MERLRSLALLAVLLSGVGASGQSPDLQITGRIAFNGWDGSDNEIWVTNSDGTGLSQVTNSPAQDLCPSWSPDGARIVYHSTGANADLYAINPDGTNQVQLNSEASDENVPYWSPDGTKVVFTSNRDGNHELYVMNAEGTGQTRLTNAAGYDYDPTWSPDGTKIAFSSERDGNTEIYVMNADGSNQTRLTNTPAFDDKPYWSPDGTKLAFETSRDGNREIYVMNADGSSPVRLTTDPANDHSPSWSPEGGRIIFHSFRDGDTRIYVMNVDGTAQTRISNQQSNAPEWTPFRRLGSVSVGSSVSRVMAIENKGDASLNVSSITANDGQFTASPANFSVAAGSSQAVTVTFTPTSAGTKYSTLTISSNDPDSPTAKLVVNGTGTGEPDLRIEGQIAFTSDRDTHAESYFEIYSMTADGTGVSRLTNNLFYDVVSSRSPDGTKVAFVSDRDGNNEIYVMNVNGSGQTRLTNNPAGDWQASWSPDGSKMIFASYRDDANGDIYSMNADGSGVRRLTDDPAEEMAPAWSPDGTRIAFMSRRTGDAEIYTMSPDGSNLQRLTSVPGADTAPSWSPDRAKIAFYSDRNGQGEVYLMNADGSNQVRLITNSADDYNAGVNGWSPDGTKILFNTNRDGNLEIYVMNADGSRQTRLTSNADFDGGGVWTPFLRIGSTPLGVPIERTMVIENMGDANLDVSGITSSDGQFTVSPAVFSLVPGGSRNVTVIFNPISAATTYSTLTIHNNDPDGTPDRPDSLVNLVVNATGEGVVASLPDTVSGYGIPILVPVRVSDTSGKGILSAEVFVAYDGALLGSPAVETTGSLLTPNWTVESHVVEGVGTPTDTLRIAMATDDDTLSGAGTLIHVRFQVADVRHPASSVLGLSHVLFNTGVPAAVVDDGSVRLVGASGMISTAPEVIRPRQSILVTVTEADENRNTSAAESLVVRVRNGSQAETMKVGETGPNSGVFQGTIATVFSGHPSPVSGDGVVQTRAGDQIIAAVTDSLDVLGYTVERADTTRVRGGKNGWVRVTIASQPGDTVRVRVADGDLNTDPGVQESTSVTAANPRTGEAEGLTLVEADVDDTVFFGTVRTTLGSGAGTPADGVINTRRADTLVVNYPDTLTAQGDTTTVVDTDKVVNPFGDADGNGQVQAYDASRVLYHRLSPYLVGLDSLTANVDLGAPLTQITAYDAALILQKRVGRIWRFPVQEDESVNHPQPETDQSVPKPAAAERVVALQPGDGYVSVWTAERQGIVSGELEIEGVSGEAAMAPELGGFLVASRVSGEGLRVVFAGAEGVKGPGELVRLSGVGPQQAHLTRACFNDGQIGVRLSEGPVAAVLPLAFALHAPHPNPFNPETMVRFDLPQAGLVRLEVFDVLGQRVRVLVSGDLPAGTHQVKWDGRNEAGVSVGSGVYLCRLQAAGSVHVRRVALLK